MVRRHKHINKANLKPRITHGVPAHVKKYFTRLKKRIKGFTIVEVLIVVIVIGILTTITVVSYNGIQARANNASRMTEYNYWLKALDLYKAQNKIYPTMPDGGYCLGTGFPGGKCRDYLANNANTYSEANSAALMDMIKATSGTVPKYGHVPVNGTVGPYINFGFNWLEITVVLNGGPNDCPNGLSYTWDDGAGRLLCYKDLQVN